MSPTFTFIATLCPVGKFGNIVGTTTVENGCPFTAATCPEGHYCPGSGGEAILCPIGKYGNAIGKTTSVWKIREHVRSMS
tara:strand:+ start:19 stop:258 length:240 start_codon:yes stop_codon:yes gene_type:complete